MGLNDVASGERLHIGFFGMRNAGKSSLVNAVTGQELSVVSKVKGTTTDPVKKAMELLPLGPVVILDTPGLDDEGELGKMRVERAMQMLSRTDIAVMVVDSAIGKSTLDVSLENELKKRGAVPINPVRVNSVLPEDSSHEDYMKLSIAVLSVCDCICMLNGWEQSKGAREELCYALDHKIPIVFEV